MNEENVDRYRVVRYTDEGKVTVWEGLTLAVARTWCELPYTEGGCSSEGYEREGDWK